MEIWGNNFFDVRNQFVIPLVPFRGDYRKSSHNNLKTALTCRFNNILNKTAKTFELEIDAEIFYKSLVNDIELFYTRSVIQYCDVKKSASLSNSWQFVTQYYFSFFTVTTLFRLLRFGFTFLKKAEVESFNSIATSILRSKIQIPTGNYFFKYLGQTTNGNIIVEIKEIGEGVHNKTWHKLSEVIDNFYLNSDNDEKGILSILKLMSQEYKNDFPSETRNLINYYGQYGIDSINNSFVFRETILPKEQYIKQLFSYRKATSLTEVAEDVGLYGYYFFLMVHDLMKDYYNRVWIKNNFQKSREEYLRLKKILIFE